MNEVDKVINIALAEAGYLEKKTNSNLDSKTGNAGLNNFTKYARDLDNISGFYNGKKNGYSWCAVFVDWCFVKALGVSRARELLCYPINSLGASCSYSIKYYKAKNRYVKSNPKKGDQIFFNGHTGLVYNVDNNYVYTIEGNTSNSAEVVANGGCVAKKKYKKNSNVIVGYGRPDYQNVNVNYSAGYYTLLFDKYLRKSHSLGNNIVKVKNTTEAIRSKLTSKLLNGLAKVKKGTTLTILEIYIDNENRVWGKNYSGWIVLQNADGTRQATISKK